jgi:hypothetical protein
MEVDAKQRFNTLIKNREIEEHFVKLLLCSKTSLLNRKKREERNI